MTVYADYTYYTGTYLGTDIASTDFSALALRASQAIDNMTFERADPIVTAATDTATIDLIKKAMCAVAEELQRQDQADGQDAIASESQGRYSVTYLASSNRSKSNQTKLETAAKFWLANTYLMFAGFMAGEYGTSLDDS